MHRNNEAQQKWLYYFEHGDEDTRKKLSKLFFNVMQFNLKNKSFFNLNESIKKGGKYI